MFSAWKTPLILCSDLLHCLFQRLEPEFLNEEVLLALVIHFFLLFIWKGNNKLFIFTLFKTNQLETLEMQPETGFSLTLDT